MEIATNTEEFKNNLLDRLRNGIAHFTFEKSDGTLREAFGTRNNDLIPKYEEKAVERLVEESRDFLVGFGTGTLIKGDDVRLNEAIKPFLPKEKRDYTPNENNISYYDLEKKAWRSFNFDKLKCIHYLNSDLK